MQNSECGIEGLSLRTPQSAIRIGIMSRIGRAPIAIPKDANIKQDGRVVSVKGPKGTLSMSLPEVISVRVDGEELRLERSAEDKSAKAMHGLYRALVANMVQGTVNGFSKELEIVGVGYRAQLQGKKLALNVGLSQQVVLEIPEGVTVEVPKPTLLTVRGIDKQVVGQFAAIVRRVAPPEPYKGKGIRYAGEAIRRKAGKAASGAGAKGS